MVRATFVVLLLFAGCGSSTSDEDLVDDTDSEGTSDLTSTGEYSDCSFDGECPDGQTCVQHVNGNQAEPAFWCGGPCDLGGNGSECEAPEGGQSTVECVLGPEDAGVCALNCEGGFACPGGMECFDGFRCTWEI